MKSPPKEFDPAQTIRDVQTVVDAFYPDHTGGDFTIHTPDGKDIKLPIPPRVLPATTPPTAPGPVGLTEFLALARVAATAGTPASIQSVAGGLRFKFEVESVADETGETGKRFSHAIRDVVILLTRTGHRMTTTQILAGLEQQGTPHGEGPVKAALARAVKDEVIDNRADSRPLGYGLPHWPRVMTGEK